MFDSMVNGIKKNRLSNKYGDVKVFHFSGAKIWRYQSLYNANYWKASRLHILHLGNNASKTNGNRGLTKTKCLLLISVYIYYNQTCKEQYPVRITIIQITQQKNSKMQHKVWLLNTSSPFSLEFRGKSL